jgi:hypothetical protein
MLKGATEHDQTGRFATLLNSIEAPEAISPAAAALLDTFQWRTEP